ncbi:hypothetical protein C8J57DRAFT_1530252 [Mycena rebaudengoi]|nr:hypothetical protein C8J57DRAFT_1530252 [Mycena rebaudengoi]
MSSHATTRFWAVDCKTVPISEDSAFVETNTVSETHLPSLEHCWTSDETLAVSLTIRLPYERRRALVETCPISKRRPLLPLPCALGQCRSPSYLRFGGLPRYFSTAILESWLEALQMVVGTLWPIRSVHLNRRDTVEFTSSVEAARVREAEESFRTAPVTVQRFNSGTSPRAFNAHQRCSRQKEEAELFLVVLFAVMVAKSLQKQEPGRFAGYWRGRVSCDYTSR